MDIKQILYTTAIGMAIGLWSQIKLLLSKLISLFICEYEFIGEASNVISSYLINPSSGFRKIHTGTRIFYSEIFRNKIENNKQNYGFEWFGPNATFLIKKKSILIVSNIGFEKDSRSSLILRFIRLTFNIDEIYKSAIDSYNNLKKEKKNRFGIYHVHGKGNRHPSNGDNPEKVAESESEEKIKRTKKLLYATWDDIGYTDDSENIDSLALSEQAATAVNDLSIWKDNEFWFRKRAIPWKTGWLLYGLPGTGKTSLIRCIGKALDMPIYCYDLSSMNNQELIDTWKKMLSDTPCVALIEDIDTIFDGRTNIAGKQGGGLTFDCLLNVLDGVTPNDGLFLAITTNRVEKLDPALGIPTNGHSTRPGRIDKAICMPSLDNNGRLKIANRILADWQHAIPSVVAEGKNDTGAQFQNRCCELALKLYWTKGA